jgi:hypothetical protein
MRSTKAAGIVIWFLPVTVVVMMNKPFTGSGNFQGETYNPLKSTHSPRTHVNFTSFRGKLRWLSRTGNPQRNVEFEVPAADDAAFFWIELE